MKLPVSSGLGGDVTQSSIKSGRKGSSRRVVASSLVSANTTSCIYRYASLKPNLQAPGQNWLSLSSAYEAGFTAQPLVMYDCTALPNWSGGVYSYPVGSRCMMRDSTGEISFSTMSGFNAAGTTSNTFQTESVPGVNQHI